MAAKKTPKSSRAPRPEPRRATDRAAPERIVSVGSLVAEIAIAALAVVSLILLARNASHAVFATDECFHAHMARWIAAHHTLPRVIPELYSGIPYFYPPLFHLVGAVSVAVAGVGSLPYLNVVLLGVLAALLFFAPLDRESRTAQRWTLALLIGNTSILVYAVRFYAETLSTLLAVVCVLLLLRLRARPGVVLAVALGAVAGLGVVAKQPGVLIPVLLGVLAVVYAVRGERRLAALLGLALGVGLLIAAPYYLRNALFFHSPFYPPVTTAAQRSLDALNTRMFSKPALSFFPEALQVAGMVIPVLALGTLVLGAWRGPRDLRLGLLAMCAGFVLVAPFIPRFEARHLNPFVAVTALLCAMMLAEAVRRERWLSLAVSVLAVVWVAVTFPAKTDYRAGLNYPQPLMDAFRAVGEHVPQNGKVLSLWTYDTFYYSGRAATWPIPWSPSADELALFTTRDPEAFLATLDRQGIDYLLVPRGNPAPTFDGGNYSESFYACFVPLVDRGRLEVVWGSPALAIVGRKR